MAGEILITIGISIDIFSFLLIFYFISEILKNESKKNRCILLELKFHCLPGCYKTQIFPITAFFKKITVIKTARYFFSGLVLEKICIL